MEIINLRTLDQRGCEARLAEVVKQGKLPDSGEFDWLIRLTTTGSRDAVFNHPDTLRMLKAYLKIDPRLRLVIGLHEGLYGKGCFTQKQIGALLGVSSGRVYQLRQIAIRKLIRGFELEMQEAARLVALRFELPGRIAAAKAEVAKMEARLAELEAESCEKEKEDKG